jgi:poly-beta-1,6-N-acetyl-D-glucosamine synthase
MQLPVRLKFVIAAAISLLWLSFCIWLALPWVRDLSAIITIVPAILVITFIALIPSFNYMFLLVSYLIDKRPNSPELKQYPPISVLIAAYNEQEHIVDTLRSINSQNYAGKIEIIVIDDGSIDGTITEVNRIKDSLAKDFLIITQSQNQGKSIALNEGLKRAKYDLIVTIDADTYLADNAIKLITERLHNSVGQWVAVAGSVHPKNASQSLITKIQDWDYFNGLAPVKRVQSMYNGTLVAQGAFSIYKKTYLVAEGGWPKSIGEDIVLTWGLLKKGYSVGFAEDAIAFTHIPENYKLFFWQRSRWARGMIEGFRHHPKILAKFRMSTLFIYWNFLMPLIDIIFSFVFLPGLLLAFWGYFYIAGPMTLAIIPLGLLNNFLFFNKQKRLFKAHDLKANRNVLGFIFYLLSYPIFMTPAVLHGYFTELFRFKSKWHTKK